MPHSHRHLHDRSRVHHGHGGLQVRDLLKENGGAQRLEIQNTRSSGTNVAGVQQVEVNNTQDVLDVMARGETNRATADTKMNERSSRSHSVLTVIVDGYNTITGALRCSSRMSSGACLATLVVHSALRGACPGYAYAVVARCAVHAWVRVSSGQNPLCCKTRVVMLLPLAWHFLPDYVACLVPHHRQGSRLAAAVGRAVSCHRLQGRRAMGACTWSTSRGQSGWAAARR